MSPLQAWLTELGMTHRRFALAAGVSGALVQAVCRGELPFKGKLRNYVATLKPLLPEQYDAWLEVERRETQRQLEAAV